MNSTTTSVSPATPNSVLNSASLIMVFTLVGGTPAMLPSFAHSATVCYTLQKYPDIVFRPFTTWGLPSWKYPDLASQPFTVYAIIKFLIYLYTTFHLQHFIYNISFFAAHDQVLNLCQSIWWTFQQLKCCLTEQIPLDLDWAEEKRYIYMCVPTSKCCSKQLTSLPGRNIPLRIKIPLATS